jgi:serine/threonine-protein kinase
MTSSTLPSPYPAPGEIIGDSWRVEKILGEGGMGAVARAWDLILHTPVAIKFMNPQFLTFPGAEERFINEGKASALIKSDHVVPVMKAGKTATGTPYLVMECLEGVDLSELMTRDGRPGLPIERAVHFVLQVLRALQAAHAVGIIHRDMKPSNCFAVTKDGEEDFVKILDFGISKIQKAGSASLTQTNSALGTPLYMSPEQAKSPRDVDARSDLYSVGVILYELLTGNTPFFSESGEFTEILFKLFTTDAPPIQSKRPDLPDELAAVVHHALARDVDRRFATALEMAEALAPFALERSRHVLTRMRAFKAPAKGSIAPPQDLPQSMVAFSNLQHEGATGAAHHRPPTDLSKGPLITEMLPRALEGGVGVAPPRLIEGSLGNQTGATSGHLSATPAAATARALPDEARAQTQYDPQAARSPVPRPVVAGASTDLSTARDASEVSSPATPKKRSPLVFALPAVVVLAIVGAALGFTRGAAEKAETSSATIAPPSAQAPVAEIVPVAPPVTNETLRQPPLPSATVAPSASASAPVVKATPRVTPPHVDARPGPRPNVLDTNIKQ